MIFYKFIAKKSDVLFAEKYHKLHFREILKYHNQTDLVEEIADSVIGDLLDRMSDYAALYCSKSTV